MRQRVMNAADLFSHTTSYIISRCSLGQSLRKVGQDSTVLLICITVFLSYLPEAGQYSSFFLYLRQVTLLPPLHI